MKIFEQKTSAEYEDEFNTEARRQVEKDVRDGKYDHVPTARYTGDTL